MDYEIGEVAVLEGKRYVVSGFAVAVSFDGEPEERRIYRLIEEETGEEKMLWGDIHKHKN